MLKRKHSLTKTNPKILKLLFPYFYHSSSPAHCAVSTCFMKQACPAMEHVLLTFQKHPQAASPMGEASIGSSYGADSIVKV